MPEVESIYGGDDNEDYLSEDDDDDGVGFGMLGGKFRLAGPGSSSVRRLSCRLKKSFSTPSFKLSGRNRGRRCSAFSKD